MFEIKRFSSFGDCSYVSHLLTGCPIPNSAARFSAENLFGEVAVRFRFGRSRGRGSGAASGAPGSVCGDRAVDDRVGRGRAQVLNRGVRRWKRGAISEDKINFRF